MRTARLPGQEEQILYSTATFRRLIDCAARPGKFNNLAGPDFFGAPPAYYSQALQAEIPVNIYALGVLLTLLDSEVSFIMAAEGQSLERYSAAVQWMLLRSGANLAEPAKANFALFCDGTSGGLLNALNPGNFLEPEASATAIYCVHRLSEEAVRNNEDWQSWELSGPGIATTRLLYIAGLDKKELQFINATRRDYPAGVDVFLIDTMGRCVGLPRSTKIKEV